ncbi:MAG TPA: tRNA uridine-5-carboxymethylaminomethyl(34) synthesis GTPase MnmE [Acidobacteriota bacterium]|nr:tRNA uridine-5-carboxymethylaminomethyl(34) synthesis GTPase MnmE [Acidobacteriota bacterium]
MRDLSDTICALSTPVGRSGIAVVRVSGAQSFEIFGRIFVQKRHSEQIPPRHAMLGKIADPGGGYEIDETIATCFPSPNSYSGEDMVEFSLHGNPVLVTALLDCLCEQGARLAEPGEFTMRAFLHGRLDLAQAEAVNDVIRATTLYQAQVAARQCSGSLSRQLKPVKKFLIDIIVNLESAVEFAEENLPTASRDVLVQQLGLVRQQIRSWIASYRQGRIVKEGFSMAVVGKPNVGKSSVFNALLAQDRSIVTEMPGTTRDLVSEITNLEGIPVRLQDTAGIHPSDDHIEKLGIDRSLEAIVDADAILLVVDRSRPHLQQDAALRQQVAHASCLVVMNKSDLPSAWSAEEMRAFAGGWPYVEVSAKTGAGIEELRTAILRGLMGTGVSQDTVLITNLRHVRSLEAAEKDLEEAAKSLQNGLSEEFALMDLQGGLKKLGVITGETSVDDLLWEIFSRFCIGK